MHSFDDSSHTTTKEFVSEHLDYKGNQQQHRHIKSPGKIEICPVPMKKD